MDYAKVYRQTLREYTNDKNDDSNWFILIDPSDCDESEFNGTGKQWLKKGVQAIYHGGITQDTSWAVTFKSKEAAEKYMKDYVIWCYEDDIKDGRAGEGVKFKAVQGPIDWLTDSSHDEDDDDDMPSQFAEALEMTDAEYFVTVPFPASDGWVDYGFMEMDADDIVSSSCNSIEEARDVALSIFQYWVDEDEENGDEGEWETAEEYLHALGYTVYDRNCKEVFHAPAAIWGEK